MNVQLETRAAIRVATFPHVGPYNTIGAAFERLGAIAGPAGLFASPDAKMVAVYFDDPATTPAERLRSAAGVTVAADAVLPPQLKELPWPAGRWARAVHRGSYAGLGKAWQQLLGQSLPDSNLQLGSGGCFEVYLNHPGNTPEADLETWLYAPIAGCVAPVSPAHRSGTVGRSLGLPVLIGTNVVMRLRHRLQHSAGTGFRGFRSSDPLQDGPPGRRWKGQKVLFRWGVLIEGALQVVR